MKYILILLIGFISCKKEDVKPTETVLVEVYCKSNNGTLKVFEAQEAITAVNYSNTYNVSENDLKFTITLKNNLKSANDSINLKVTYKGVVQQKGLKCINTIGTISLNI